jgi:hypothetical protein
MEVLRVVALRKGKLKVIEFQLREKEPGLSLFAAVERPGPAEVVEAVRAMGKQGDLQAALFSVEQITSLGLKLVKTPGGTSSSAVNAIHFEARLPMWQRVASRCRGVTPQDHFNQTVSPKLCALARLVEASS